jgi:hypothetical protein
MRRGGDTEQSRQIKGKGTASPRWRDYHAGALVIQAALPPFRLNENLSTLGQALSHHRWASLSAAISVFTLPHSGPFYAPEVAAEPYYVAIRLHSMFM